MVILRSIKWLKTYPRYVISHFRYNASMVENKPSDRIVWIDMEMTGLDIDNCHILEVACLITDKDLKVIGDDLNLVIHQPNSILENMTDWCKVQHKKSGLTDEVRSSKIMLEDATQMLLKHLQKYVPEKKCPLAGNTVYMDAMFLRKYMPLVHDYLHYRIIDVSSIKELVKRWNLDVGTYPKSEIHRALPDINNSIRELQYYKAHIFDRHCK